MTHKKLNWLVRISSLLLWLCAAQSVHAMTYDNRFWPLFREPFFSFQDATFDYGVRALFMGSHRMYAQSVEEALMFGDEHPLYRLYGLYDEVVLDKALRDAGITQDSLFRSDLQTMSNAHWAQHGKISLCGGVIEAFLNVSQAVGIGTSLLLAKVNAHVDLEPNFDRGLTPGDAQELMLANKKMHDLMGLTAPCYSNFTAGDVDLYLRFHAKRDYWCRIHHLDVGCNLGFLIPTAKKASIYNPAAIALGADGHFGMYGEFEGRFVLKDDIAVGLLFRVSKRFARTSVQRMPLLTEPTNYGVLVGPARVSPGVTLVFEPRLELTGLRDGLGVNVAYILTHHFEDSWSDRRSDQKMPANIALLQERSSWGSDYVSVSALYDFGYEREDSLIAPILSLTVDIPFKGAATKRVSKTHAISLRIESRL